MFQTHKEDGDALRDCYVGQLKRREDAFHFQQVLFKEGFFSIKATPLGGGCVLLKGGDREEISEILAKEKIWIDGWFNKIELWKPALFPKERFVWVIILGVSLHAWNEEFFRLVTKSSREFIKSDSSTMRKERMDRAKVLISTSIVTKVDSVAQVKVDDMVIEIRVMEERWGGDDLGGKEYASRQRRWDSDEEFSSSSHSYFNGAGEMSGFETEEEWVTETGAGEVGTVNEGCLGDGDLVCQKVLSIVQETNEFQIQGSEKDGGGKGAAVESPLFERDIPFSSDKKETEPFLAISHDTRFSDVLPRSRDGSLPKDGLIEMDSENGLLLGHSGNSSAVKETPNSIKQIGLCVTQTNPKIILSRSPSKQVNSTGPDFVICLNGPSLSAVAPRRYVQKKTTGKERRGVFKGSKFETGSTFGLKNQVASVKKRNKGLRSKPKALLCQPTKRLMIQCSQRKSSSRSNRRRLSRLSTVSESSAVGNSDSLSHTNNCPPVSSEEGKHHIREGKARINAERLWSTGKQMRVTFPGEDEMMIEALKDLEVRDELLAAQSNHGDQYVNQ
ncbi:hypothetical protein RIF29_12576 [Crotalaria pallida]|uniref:DUF4283 domain-containing protein n=1 Tax=Crotalaria pallida TaxID=3830 RepID=A0AAN9P278_CROPI